MSGSEFHFLRPLWLLALLPLGLLLWQLWRGRGGGEAWRSVVDAHLLRHLLSGAPGRAERLPLVLLAVGWLVLVLALAGPAWQRLPEPLYQAQQYRVVVLDLTPSMNATDLAPTRLARARFEVLDILRLSREGQTALLAYGAEPYVVSPLTRDVETIAAQVPSLATGLLPVAGARRTDLALEQAAALLRQAGAPQGQVILVTDGVDDRPAAVAAAGRLRTAGYRVSVLGVGTTKGGPVRGPDGELFKDAQGAIRLARLDLAALRALAEAGGGRYVTARADDRDIALLRPQRPTVGDGRPDDPAVETDRWHEEGPWLLLLLLPIAALAFRRGWLSPLLLLVCVLPPDASAVEWDALWLRPDQRAARLLDEGRPDQAAEVFESQDWRAAAHYRAGDYAQALQTLQGLDGPEIDYNRGNALAYMDRLKDALAAYDRTLAADPDHADARHNRDLVWRLIEQRRQAADRPTPQDPDSPTAQQQQAAQDRLSDAQQEQDGAQDEQQQAGQGSESEQQAAGPGDESERQAAPGEQDQADDADAQGAGQQQAATGEQQGEQSQGATRPEQASAADGQDAGASNGETTGDAAQGTQATAGQGQAAGAERQTAAGEGDADPQAQGADQTAGEGSQDDEEQYAAAATAVGEEAPQSKGESQTEPGGPDGDQEPRQASAGEEQGDAAGSAGRKTETGQGDDDPGARPGDQADTAEGPDRVEGSVGEQAAGQPRADGPGGEPGGSERAAGDPDGARGGLRSAAVDEGEGAPDGPGGLSPQAPGMDDLLADGPDPATGGRRTDRVSSLSPEDRQAVEQLLRRVEDDPAALLRQRFLLQHLRRSGRLP